MKQFFILLILLSSTFCQAQNSWSDWNLKDSVDKLIETNYFVNVAGVKTDSVMEIKEFQFDSLGNTQQLKVTKANKIRIQKYYYDQYGQDTLCLVFVNDTVEHKWRKTYTDKKLIKIQLLSDSDSITLESNYYYQTNGKDYVYETYTAKKLTLKAVSTHDALGRIIQDLWYDKDGVLTDNWLYVYDKHGNESENIGFDFKENEYYHDKYYFNKQRDWVKYEELDSLGKIITKSKWKYKYDKKKNWVEEKKFEDGKLVHYISRKIIYK